MSNFGSEWADGYNYALLEIKEAIDFERDNGNLENEKGFSPALCLSGLLKFIDERLNEENKK